MKSVFVTTSHIVAAKRLKCINFYRTAVPVLVWHYKCVASKHKSIAKSIMKVYDSFSLDHFKPFLSDSQCNFAQISLLKGLGNEKRYSTTAIMVVEQAFVKLFEFYRTPIKDMRCFVLLSFCLSAYIRSYRNVINHKRDNEYIVL